MITWFTKWWFMVVVVVPSGVLPVVKGLCHITVNRVAGLLAITDTPLPVLSYRPPGVRYYITRMTSSRRVHGSFGGMYDVWCYGLLFSKGCDLRPLATTLTTRYDYYHYYLNMLTVFNPGSCFIWWYYVCAVFWVTTPYLIATTTSSRW